MPFIFLVDCVPRSFIAHSDTDANVNADAKAVTDAEVADAEAEAVVDAQAEAVADAKGDSNELVNPKTKSVVNEASLQETLLFEIKRELAEFKWTFKGNFQTIEFLRPEMLKIVVKIVFFLLKIFLI